MINFTDNDLDIIVNALKGEGRALRNMINELEHRDLHIPGQNMEMQKRVGQINTLIGKIMDNRN